MKKENNISQREQLLAITSAIILAGLVSNYTSSGASETNIIIARCTARKLLTSILDNKEKVSE